MSEGLESISEVPPEAGEARSWAATVSRISVGRSWTLACPPELSAFVAPSVVRLSCVIRPWDTEVSDDAHRRLVSLRGMSRSVPRGTVSSPEPLLWLLREGLRRVIAEAIRVDGRPVLGLAADGAPLEDVLPVARGESSDDRGVLPAWREAASRITVHPSVGVQVVLDVSALSGCTLAVHREECRRTASTVLFGRGELLWTVGGDLRESPLSSVVRLVRHGLHQCLGIAVELDGRPIGGLLDDDPPHRLGACPW